jgi:hypothetical protein
VLADTEHFNGQLTEQVRRDTRFDLLVPMPNQKSRGRRAAALSPSLFTPHWAGFATAKQPFGGSPQTEGPFYEIIQRSGERPDDFHFQSFLATADRPEVADLTVHYPQRWHVEVFFKLNQALGWHRAGTLNLNIRYGHMTLALIAQAVLHQFRQRLGPPFAAWEATHLAQAVFGGLEGDLRVEDDPIVITYYNAPNVSLVREHYEHLPPNCRPKRSAPKSRGFTISNWIFISN